MSDASTKRMIEGYMAEASAPMFLSGLFQTPPRNFHNSEKVELDIVREDEDVAVPLVSMSASGRENEAAKYINKAFEPPVYDEIGTINGFDLNKRQPGVNPFEDVDAMQALSLGAFSIARKLENKVRRAVELQCSQVLQTGVLTLADASGTIYSLDYQPKAAHFVTVGTTWSTTGAAGAPLSDIASLAEVLRKNGKKNPNRLIFGESAFQRFLANADVQKRVERDGLGIGGLAPQLRGEGGTFQGFVWVGNYRFEMWTYGAYYKDPATGTLTPYVSSEKVIMLSDGSRLDLTFGEVPRVVPPDPRVMNVLPSRMSSAERGLDLSMFAYATPDGKHLKVSVASRPLAIPTAIDTFGCIDCTT